MSLSRRMTAVAALFMLPAAAVLSTFAFWRREAEPEDPSGSLAPADYRQFLQVVATYFALRNMRATFERGEVVVDRPGGRTRHPLAELALACSQCQHDRWPQVVGQHFAAPDERGASWPDVAPKARPPANPEAPELREPAPPKPVLPADGGVPAPRAAVPPPVRPAEPPALRATVPPPAHPAEPAPTAREAVLRPPVTPRPEGVEPPARMPPRVEPTPPARTPPRPTPDPPVVPPRVPEPPAPAAAAGSVPAGPEAAGGDGRAGDWLAFRALVRDYFRRHGLAATVERDHVLARDVNGRQRRFDVPGLDRVVCELRREQWPRFVETVFELLLSEPGGKGPAGRSLEEVRGALAIQLFDAAALDEAEREASIYADELPGLLSTLVYRARGRTVRVRPEMVEGWGVSAEEAFALGLANLRRLAPPATKVELAPGVEGLRWLSDDELAAAHALLLADEPRCSGRYGAVLAVPRGGLLVACPLRPLPAAETAYAGALMGLITCIMESERDGHALLSRRLYWHRDGRFVELPYQVRQEGGEPIVGLYPPEEFLAALAELGGEAP